MSARRETVLLLLVAVVLCAFSPVGEDTPSAERVKSQLRDVKEEIRKAKSDHEFADIVHHLSQTRHPLVAEYLGRILLKSKNVERQLITAELLADFGEPEPLRKAAGAGLREKLKARDVDLDVLESCVLGVAKLKYVPAIPELARVLDRWIADPWMPETVLDAWGLIRDRKALPHLLVAWERAEETDPSKVAKGASGAAGGRRSSGRTRPKAPTPEQLKQAFADTAVALTGDATIAKAADLRTWMEARAKELRKIGVKIPKR